MPTEWKDGGATHRETKGESKTNIKWENPKQFLPLLLFFGIVLVVVGTGIESITTNPALATDGWIVVAIAVSLWVLKEFKDKI